MSWNHKSRVVAMGITIQPTPGVFNPPGVNDLIAVSSPTNSSEIIETEDPTATGSVWDAPSIYLGETGSAGATIPLRGPGGAAPFASGAWPVGRILQSAGFAEIINAAAITAAAAAGGTVNSIVLDAAASSVDDLYLGMPIRHAGIGAGVVKSTSVIESYAGASKTATLAETLGAPVVSGNYEIPPHVLYQLGTLTQDPPLLSISVWRDKKRYDYKDCRVSSLTIDMAVANEQNQVFPSLEAQFKGLVEDEVDDVTPVLPASVLAVAIPPYRSGKFSLDRVKLGHQSNRFSMNAEVAGASNSHQDAGQDGYEIMSGTRSLELDLNQSNVTDMDLRARVEAQTVMSQMSVWGTGPGNRFSFLVPRLMLNPFSPGDRNGFVNLTGNAKFASVDKSAAFAVAW